MRREPLVERACLVLNSRIAELAQDAEKHKGPNDDFAMSYSHILPLSDLFPANIRGNVGPVLDCINEALERHGFITDKALLEYNDLDVEALRAHNEFANPPKHYARIGTIDRTVSDLQDVGYQEAHLCFTDPVAVRRKFGDIANTACEIAHERDLGHDDRPLT